MLPPKLGKSPMQSRETAATQFEAADGRFREVGIAEPTQAAEDVARGDVQRLLDEGKALSANIEELRKTQGRYEAERIRRARTSIRRRKKLLTNGAKPHRPLNAGIVFVRRGR